MANAIYIGEKNLIIKALEAKFNELGHSLVIETNPLQGINIVYKDKFDMIITNILNEEVDGVQIFQIIKNSNNLNSVTPFVVITSGENIDKLFGSSTGPDYIFKKDSELVENIINAL